jgi:hypothetical protein
MASATVRRRPDGIYEIGQHIRRRRMTPMHRLAMALCATIAAGALAYGLGAMTALQIIIAVALPVVLLAVVDVIVVAASRPSPGAADPSPAPLAAGERRRSMAPARTLAMALGATVAASTLAYALGAVTALEIIVAVALPVVLLCAVDLIVVAASAPVGGARDPSPGLRILSEFRADARRVRATQLGA